MRFKPSPKMKLLYTVYFVAGLVLGVFSWLVPLTVFMFSPAIYVLYAVTVAGVLLFAYWLPRYYESITYELRRDGVYARSGVWWVKESYVPYVKVNNVVRGWGPLKRALGLVDVSVHTAAMGTPRPEVILGNLDLETASKVEEKLLERVVLTPSGGTEGLAAEILRELKRIRKLLEKFFV